MNNIWMLTVEDYIKIMEEAIKLGLERGKKEAEEMSQEFFEVAKKKGIVDNKNILEKRIKIKTFFAGI